MHPETVSTNSNARHEEASPAAFACWWTKASPGVAWVHVAGELDLRTVPQLERALHESQVRARLVVLDLRELVFMDSSGVHAIVNASTRAQQLGVRLVLQRGAAHVDRMFALTMSSDAVEICDLHSVKPPIRASGQLPEETLAFAEPPHCGKALRRRTVGVDGG